MADETVSALRGAEKKKRFHLRNDSNIISMDFVAKNDYLGNGTIDHFPN